MKINEVIDQLDNLRFHCQEMARDGSEEWEKDVEALTIAMQQLKKKNGVHYFMVENTIDEVGIKTNSFPCGTLEEAKKELQKRADYMRDLGTGTIWEITAYFEGFVVKIKRDLIFTTNKSLEELWDFEKTVQYRTLKEV